MNCIDGITCSAGMPFSAWMFLYSSSASLGAVAEPPSDSALGGVDCPSAPKTRSRADNEIPQTKIQPLQRTRFMNSTLALLCDGIAGEVVAASPEKAASLQ